MTPKKPYAQRLKEYTCGVMSSKWKIQAKNADIAICASYIFTQSQAPIAIYEPEGEQSQFIAIGITKEGKEMNDFHKFIEINIEEIKAALKTLKQVHA